MISEQRDIGPLDLSAPPSMPACAPLGLGAALFGQQKADHTRAAAKLRQ